MNSREYDVAQLDELVGVDGREVLTRRLRWRHEERDTRPASAGSTKGNLIPATPPSSPPPLPGPIVDAKTIISFLAAPAKRTATATAFLFHPHPFSLYALLILIHLHAMHTPLSHSNDTIYTRHTGVRQGFLLKPSFWVLEEMRT